MSAKAAAAALELRLGKYGAPALAETVVMVLADRHNKDTNRCAPAINRIAEEAETSRRTTFRILKWLEEWNVVRRHNRMSPAGDLTSNSYELLFLEEGWSGVRFVGAAEQGGQCQTGTRIVPQQSDCGVLS